MPAAQPLSATLKGEGAPGMAGALASRAPAVPGFSPYPAPPGGPVGQVSAPRPAPAMLSYPAGPAGYTMSPNPAASPRFQYPNGVLAPLPAPERRRLLITILGIAFVAVGAGIVMALFHSSGGDDGARRAAAPAATPTTPAAAPAATPAAATTPAAPTPAAPAMTPTAGTRPTAAPAVRPAAGTATAAAPAALDLYGRRALRPGDFGTDEELLADLNTSSQQTAPPSRESGDAHEERESRESAREARREARRRARARDTGGDAEEREARVDDGGGRDAGGTDGALRQAEALYRQKKFSDAAALLRRAADSAGSRDVSRLRALAVNYAKIGSLLAEGQEATASDAPRALQAFKNALRLDEEFGDSVHDRAIGARIAQVAPAAAGAYMARKDYAEAKAAADLADKFGAGDSDRVRIVRGSLERRAEQLLEEAQARADAGDSGGAAESARQVLRMVPRASDLYGRASKLASGS
jgi:hypothetical protein